MEATDFLCATKAFSKMMFQVIPKTDIFYRHLGQRQMALRLKAALAQAKLPS